MLPFEPQHMNSARNRYAAALDDLYDHKDPATFVGVSRPGTQRRHVFDFPDGLRLIVSRERTTLGEVFIHLSASWHPGTTMDVSMSMALGTGGEEDAKKHFTGRAVERWRDLAFVGREHPVDLIAWTPKGIPHWRTAP